jgi:uncharacterized membrane protein (DUF485 family)
MMSEPTKRKSGGLPSADRLAPARLGLVFFGAYLVIYGGYVWLSAFHPDLIGRELMWGLNVAIVYGFGLIILAFGLAVGYLFLLDRGQDDD